MAALSNEDRRRVWAHFMRQSFGGAAVTKAQLRGAVDAVDDFLESNAAALNTAIPLPARTGMTAAQKAALVGYVALRRAGLLQAQEDV